MADRIDTVVFDLGGVVLHWEPERAFQQVMPAEEVDDFMEEISFGDWNRRHDAGRDLAEGEAELISRLPHRRDEIEAYRRYFDRTISGMVPGTGAIIAELQRAGVRLVALTNWSADLFRPTRRRFGLLNRFEGIVVSGEERIAKPDPALFQVVFDRYDVDPERAAFVDDSDPNCVTAEELGMAAIRFTDADRLRERLVELGVLSEPEPVTGPIYHLAKRCHWEKAQDKGRYCWSSRRETYEAVGFLHCSFAQQVAGVRQECYGDLADDDLVLIRFDPARLSAPVIVESTDSGAGFPHLYGPLPVSEVDEVLPYQPVPSDAAPAGQSTG